MIKRLFAALLLLLGSAFVIVPGLAQDETNEAAAVYEQAADSVVAINVIRDIDASAGGPSGGSGSGFVIDNAGHIVTNNHVVEGATEIEVNFLDGTLARGIVVGLDPDSDIAVLRVELPQEELVPVEFADSESLFVGQPVYAIGSPFGQRWTLTRGIISALDRTISGLDQFSIGGVIQTDAAINPGNSGGPLLDDQARVIGVNSQILSAVRSSSGVGFAVPANLVQRVAHDLIDQGFVEYSYIGIGGGNVTLSVVEDLQLPNDTTGIVVSTVAARGPAARAGLQALETGEENGDLVIQSADIITSIDGQTVRGMEQLISYLARNTSPSDRITATVLRVADNRAEEIEFEIALAPRP